MEVAQFIDPEIIHDTQDEQKAVQELHDQVGELQAMSDVLQETPILTTELALESVRVLGSNAVLEAHYGALSKPQKHRIAVESIQENFRAAIRKFFDMLRDLIRKAIAWLKKLTSRGGKAPSEKKVSTAKAELQKTAQVLKGTQEVVKSEVKDDFAQKYIDGLTNAEYGILTGASFNDKLTDLRRELAHDHRAFEFESAITSMTKWVGHASGLVQEFMSDHKNDGDEFPHTAYDEMVEKLFLEAADLMKQHTTPLEKITDVLHELQDEREKWQRGGVPEYADDLAAVMDHVVSNTTRYAQFTKDGIWSTWKTQLEKAERDVDATVVAITTLIEKNEDEGAHYAYNLVMQIQRNVLRYLPHWIVEMNHVLTEIAAQSDAAVTLTTKTLRYIATAASSMKAGLDDPEAAKALAEHAKASIERIETAGN